MSACSDTPSSAGAAAQAAGSSASTPFCSPSISPPGPGRCLTFRGHPVLLGTALLAYSFGLRHAVDADHIAAIDNVTRKLMQEGKRPVSVGFFFALGHSTVVHRCSRWRSR